MEIPAPRPPRPRSEERSLELEGRQLLYRRPYMAGLAADPVQFAAAPISSMIVSSLISIISSTARRRVILRIVVPFSEWDRADVAISQGPATGTLYSGRGVPLTKS